MVKSRDGFLASCRGAAFLEVTRRTQRNCGASSKVCKARAARRYELVWRR